MKFTIIIFIIFFNHTAMADISSCVQEARFHGTDKRLLTTSDECEEALQNHPSSAIVKTKDEKISIYALANMIYVAQGEDSGLIAGDQTRLTNITSVSIYEKEKILLVYQDQGKKSNVIQFILGETGNVVPGRYLEGEYLKGLSSVKLNPTAKELELISRDAKKVTYVWSEGDSRYGNDQPELAPKVLRVNNLP